MILASIPILSFSLLVACQSTNDSTEISEHSREDFLALQSLISSAHNEKTFFSVKNSENVFYDTSSNVLGSLEFSENHSFLNQPYVANGYFGARIPNLGHGFASDSSSQEKKNQTEILKNGWPLFNGRFAGAIVAGFFDSQENTTGFNFPWLYQYGWDSVISVIPQWTNLDLAAEGFSLDPERPPVTWGTIKNYMQNMSLEDGIVSTSYLWLDKLQVQYDIVANKHDINLGTVFLKVENPTDFPILITVRDKIDFRTSQRCEFVSSKLDGHDGIEMIVTPEGVKDSYAVIYSRLTCEKDCKGNVVFEDNTLDVSHSIKTTIFPGERVKFVKYVGIHTTDLHPQLYKSHEDVSSAAKRTAGQSNSKILHELHKKAWSLTLGHTASIEFPDSPFLTLASRASIYHINANMREGATGLTAALSVSGLSSDSYGGQVFWDTDLWMSMGILPFNPQISKSILSYRLQTREQAIVNIASPSNNKHRVSGAIYPWTSGRYGNCTATGPCFDYEYHINAAIAYSAIQLYLSGAIDECYLEHVIFPIVLDAAILFATYVEFDPELSQFVTKNLTDPDEFAEHVDNGAYTNAAISMIIKWAIILAKHLGKSMPPNFFSIRGNLHLPYSSDDANLVMEYTGMNSTIGVKQADVIMITYPLENELISKDVAIENLKFYASKQVSTGPAMTFSIFSIVSSAVLDTGCSTESYLLKSVQPFLRGPFAQFSEQSDDNFETNGGTHPAFPFLTAHGGFLQTVLMGLLGMRFSYEVKNDKIERFLLFRARELSLFPNGLKLGEIKYMNVSLSITLSGSILTVKNNGPIAGTELLGKKIKIVSQSDFNVTESAFLGNQETAIFKVASRGKASPSSTTECNLASFMNLSSGAHGEVVASMHDGDNSTYWQARPEGEARILIKLARKDVLKGGYINWGDAPARILKVDVHDWCHEANESVLVGHTQNRSEPYSSFKHSRFKSSNDQGCTPKTAFTGEVKITAPFDVEEYSRISLVKRHNITVFEFAHPMNCSILSIRFSGLYQDGAGAKVYDVNFF